MQNICKHVIIRLGGVDNQATRKVSVHLARTIFFIFRNYELLDKYMYASKNAIKAAKVM